ncbi:MAG: hypothetical protein OHK005_03090 [Candidatus Methylacidiphilales bacterium]
MPTSISIALKKLRRERQERAIEDLLFAYPGLIHPELARPRRQTCLGPDSRADLLFEIGNRFVLVEIKRDIIRPAAVRQIERYGRGLSVALSRISGYLVAPEIDPQAEQCLAKASFPIRFLRLGVDIPPAIHICLRCRRAYDRRLSACPFDGETRTI